MTSQEMTDLVNDYLVGCQKLGLEREALPPLLQTLGLKKCGDLLALWELPEVDGFYHFEVRLGIDPAGPLVTEWVYRPE